jgi:hypothetical protein
MRTFLLLSALLFLPLASGQADTIDLYTGEVLVESQDSSERRRALPLALEHVLQKISGLRYFEDYPLVEPVLDNASSMMVSFHYRNVETMLADGSRGTELRLVVNFAGAKVDDLARRLQLPLWQPGRSPIEVWVVVDDGLDRRIFPVQFSYAWESMDETAVRRGLALRWPRPDEDGLYAIDTQILWGGYTEDLVRGRRGGVMIAAARREGLEWSLRNNLSYDGRDWTWRVQDIDLQAALTESLQQAIDRVAAANTIAASDLGSATEEITVGGVRNAADYRRCLAYLQQVSVVESVDVVSARRGTVVFRLGLNALPQYLEEALEGGGVVEFNEDVESYLLLP